MEGGKNNHRPQLLAAIAEARRVGATLLITKLDQLSLNAEFVFALRDAGVGFVCCDRPAANTLTVGLSAVLAQLGRVTISRRTKDALTANKAHGAQLGTPANLTDVARAKGRAVMQQHAAAHQANRQAGLVRGQGHSLPHIAAELTVAGYCTRRGGVFHPTTVHRLLQRAAAAPGLASVQEGLMPPPKRG